MYPEEDFDQIGPRVAEKSEEKEEKKDPEPLVRDDSWRQDAPVREWDMGKKGEDGLAYTSTPFSLMYHNYQEC